MALNFSRPTIFPAHLPEDNLVAPFMIANNLLMEGGGSVDSQESVSRDILDLLPADPFGMGISSTFTAAITGLLEDLEVDCGFGSAEVGTNRGDHSLFAGWNLIWGFGSSSENVKLVDKMTSGMGGSSCHGVSGNVCQMEDLFSQYGVTNYSEMVGGVYVDCSGNLKVDDKIQVVGDILCPRASDRVCNIEDASSSNVKLVDKTTSGMGGSSCHGVSGKVCQMENVFSQYGVANYSEMVGGVYADCSGNLKVDDQIQVLGDILCPRASDTVCSIEDASSSNVSDSYAETLTGIYAEVDNESPYNALVFALGYLGVYDLLNVERVCKSLCHTVQNDPLLWRSIHIDQRLSERITDDIFLQLTDRAQGKLQSLSLVECTKITDDGLKRVLDRNLSLTKLSVPGCTRLSIDGVVSCLKAFNSVATPGIKRLRIGGLYGMTDRHFEILKILLASDNQMPAHARKPHFYRRGSFFLSVEDDRAIDIEVCPRCQNFRQLYDCPAEEHNAQVCRACIICIPRCVDCGRCINDGEFEETFCLELLCSVCGEQSLDCQVKRETRVSPPTHCNYQEASFSFQG